MKASDADFGLIMIYLNSETYKEVRKWTWKLGFWILKKLWLSTMFPRVLKSTRFTNNTSFLLLSRGKNSGKVGLCLVIAKAVTCAHREIGSAKLATNCLLLLLRDSLRPLFDFFADPQPHGSNLTNRG